MERELQRERGKRREMPRARKTDGTEKERKVHRERERESSDWFSALESYLPRPFP